VSDVLSSFLGMLGFARLGRARFVALIFVFLWFLIGGIAHFVATDT